MSDGWFDQFVLERIDLEAALTDPPNTLHLPGFALTSKDVGDALTALVTPPVPEHNPLAVPDPERNPFAPPPPERPRPAGGAERPRFRPVHTGALRPAALHLAGHGSVG